VHWDRKGSNPNGNQSIPKDKAAGSWKFTAHIHSIPRVWMSAEIAPCLYVVVGRIRKTFRKRKCCIHLRCEWIRFRWIQSCTGGGKISTV